MIIYAAAIAVMFICQNGLTGVIQAPPRRPRPPRASKAPKPLGSITITTTARPTRWLFLALASLARAGHESEETYVIQALQPEAIPALDAAVPDGVSRLALSAGSNNSTRVDYAVARNGRRKGVAQIHRLRPSDCAGADFVSLQYRVVEPQSVEGYVGVRLVLLEGSHCQETATAERCLNDVDLLEQYHSYHFILDDISNEWKELRVGLCGDEDPRSPFWRLDRFGAAGDGHLDPAALKGWQLKFVGADHSVGEAVAGAVELRELACIGSGLVGSMLEKHWAEPAVDAPWHAAHAVRAAVADGDVAITYAEPTSYTLSRTLPDDSYYKFDGAVIAYETDATATFELLDGRADRVVSGTGRGSLTVGAADGAHITGLRLTVDATAAGNTSFSKLRAIGAPDHDHGAAQDCRDSDDARCAHVEGVFLDVDEATRTIPFGHRECCQHCLDEPNCTFYSVAAGSSVASFTPTCHLFAAPRVVKLAEETVAERAMSTHWVLDRQRRGELCDVCTCIESSADCRGRDLRTVPYADDDAIASLDLRENPRLGVIPSGALTGLRGLEEVLLPVDVKFVSPGASAPDVAIIPAAGTRANVVATPQGFFASECCGLGAPTGAGGHFCDEQVERDAPGADALFYEGYTFASETIYLRITPSSAHFGEAAGSAQLCASYCAMSENCWAFTHTEPKREMTLLPICRMHTKEALDLPLEDLSDRRQTWTAGVPPRTRKLRGAGVVAPQRVDAERDGEQYRAEFSVSLGVAPTRGAIWMTPEVRPTDGGRPLARVTFDPPRFALYDANASVPVTMTAALPTYASRVVVSFRVVSCDAAFNEDVQEAVRVRIPRLDDDDDDNSHKHRRRAKRTERTAIIAGTIIGAALLVGCAVAGCWYVNRSLREKDRLQAERRVTVQQQVGEFQSTFNVIPGNAFLALGGLGRDAYYEQQRDAGKLISFDVVADVEEVKKRDGVVFVFLSHQWLSFGGPDPQGLQYAAACNAVRAVARRVEADPKDLRIWFDVISVPQKNKALQAFAISSLPTYASTCDVFVVIAPPTVHRDTCVACDEASYRARTWCRAEVMSCWARNGAETMYMCNGDTLERFDVNAEALDVFGGGLTCCTRCHPDGVCDKEALVLPMLGLFVELYENRHRDGKVVSLSSLESARDGAEAVTPDEAPAVLRERRSFAGLEPLATAARGRPNYATVEPLLERLYPRTFEWSRQAADGSTITETAPLFGDLIDAVKWYADRKEGDAGEPPDFAPGTNARRRTALKTPPTKHGRSSRLLSAMSFRSTRSLAAASVGSGSSRSATSSRKSYRG